MNFFFSLQGLQRKQITRKVLFVLCTFFLQHLQILPEQWHVWMPCLPGEWRMQMSSGAQQASRCRCWLSWQPAVPFGLVGHCTAVSLPPCRGLPNKGGQPSHILFQIEPNKWTWWTPSLFFPLIAPLFPFLFAFLFKPSAPALRFPFKTEGLVPLPAGEAVTNSPPFPASSGIASAQGNPLPKVTAPSRRLHDCDQHGV